jgi:nucleoside-diphosphate-sugar epimerase
MKNILIIGGSYFAGRVFVEALARTKAVNIFVYNRGRVPLRMEGVTELVGDRENEDQIREVIPDKNWDALVDFCAYTPDHVDKMIGSLRGSVTHYILISTTSIYRNTWSLPIDEDGPKLSAPQPELGLYADYGWQKWLTECRLLELCAQKGIPYTVLRPAIIYGRYNYAPRESYFFDLIRDGAPVILPENDLALFSFVWVVDLAKIIGSSLLNSKVFNQAFNVAAEELISYRRLVEVLEEISGKKIPTLTMSMAEIERNKIPLPFPLDSHLIYSGARIQRFLDFSYTPFLEGMKKTYEFYLRVQEINAAR